ncbi:MAG: hypothetical protein WCY28_03820, partial [Candidatus Shapirobacteria bacterium]
MATKPAKECLYCHSKTRNTKANFCWNCGKPYQQNIKLMITYIGYRILGGITMKESKAKLLIDEEEMEEERREKKMKTLKIILRI